MDRPVLERHSRDRRPGRNTNTCGHEAGEPDAGPVVAGETGKSDGPAVGPATAAAGRPATRRPGAGRSFGRPQVPSPIGLRPGQPPAARSAAGAGRIRRGPTRTERAAVWFGAHPVALGLIGGVLLLVGSALVGALDLFAIGAVLGFWALIAAVGLVLGRPGEDWQIPTEQIRVGVRWTRAAAARAARRTGGWLIRTGTTTVRRVRRPGRGT